MMYSLTAVGGIQYTTEMANKSKTNNIKRDSLRVKVKEEVVVGSTTGPGTSVVKVTTDSTGTSSVQFALGPAGLQGAVLASGAYTNASNFNIDYPHLRKLYNLAVDFRMYRVLSGKLIFVPNYGANVTGLLALASSRDVSDVGQSAQIAYASAANYRVFNMSQVNKEMAVPLDVDTAWKKVTPLLSVANNSPPFTAASSNTTVVNMNTVNDLCFSGIGCTVNTGPASAAVGVLVVEYEVEFKGLIDSAVNV